MAPMGDMPNMPGNLMPIPFRHFIPPFLADPFPWQKERFKPKINIVISPFCRQIKALDWPDPAT